MTEYFEHITDVLVIGGGGAGARAALEAAKNGAMVTLIDKGVFGTSGSTAYGIVETAGLSASDGQVDEFDTPEEHYKDILEAAQGTCSPTLARIVAEEAPQVIKDLEEIGVNIERDSKGKYIEVRGCFASKPRMHIIKNHAIPIIRALAKGLEKAQVKILNKTTAIDLIVYKSCCYGALCINDEGELILIKAKAVILTTGGAGQLFKYNQNPTEITGDGYGLGWRAGAKLVNMEFMQAGVGIIHPTKIFLSAWMWEGKPVLYNDKGINFLTKYIPEGITEESCILEKSRHFPFSSRDMSRYIEISIQNELKKNPQSKVFLDLTKSQEYINNLPKKSDFHKMWDVTKKWMLDCGLDITANAAQVACFGHAINGGLLIDGNGETSIKNLFAAGETAGGPHGADRLGGNMLVTCQIFGKRAGIKAANNAREKTLLDINKIFKSRINEIMNQVPKINKLDKDTVNRMKINLQDLFWQNFLVTKDANSLKSCIEGLNKIKEEFTKSDLGLNRESLELRNLIDTSNIMSSVALMRDESRGSHYREDSPLTKAQWSESITIWNKYGKSQFAREKLV